MNCCLARNIKIFYNKSTPWECSSMDDLIMEIKRIPVRFPATPKVSN